MIMHWADPGSCFLSGETMEQPRLGSSLARGGISPAACNPPTKQHWLDPAPQGHINCWWLNTKWSMAILVVVTAGVRGPPPVGPFRASVQQPPEFISTVCGGGNGKSLPLLVLPKDGGLCACSCVF